MEVLPALFTSEASLTFIDLLPLAKKILKIYKCLLLCFDYVFSHDLSFENGGVISLTSDARKRCHEHHSRF